MPSPQVLLTVPPADRYVRLLRVVASASGAAAGLAVDRLEELGLAVDEAAGAVLSRSGVATLECALTAGTGKVAVRVSGRGGLAAEWPPNDWDSSLAALVLDGVATDVELAPTEAGPAVSFSISSG